MKNPRGPVAVAIKNAWESTIAKYYNTEDSSPAIGSEAGLQAYLMVELDAAIRVLEQAGNMPTNTRIFIEPCIFFQGSISKTQIVPDLIVCRNRSVIAVMELKYTPRLGLAESEKTQSFGLQKDLTSFIDLYEKSQSDNKPSFRHERYFGKFSQRFEIFNFSKQTLFIWGGVHKSATNSLKATFYQQLEQVPLFEMHANTEENKNATTAYFFDGRALRDLIEPLLPEIESDITGS